MSSNKCILKVSLALVPLNTPPGSQARQDDLIPRMLEFSSADDRIAVGRSSSGRSPVPSLFNALFHSRSVSRQHAELSVDPRTNLLMVEDLRSMHGTYLNGTKLASGITHYVHSGDLLQFGSDIQHEDRGHFAPRSFKVSYGSAPPATRHTIPIQARRPGSFKVPETTTDEEEEDSEVEIVYSTDTSFSNSQQKSHGIPAIEVVSDSEDEVQVLSVTKRNPVGVALKDLFNEDDDECSTPLSFKAVTSTSTPQATIEHPTTVVMGTEPSQERMRISNILADQTQDVFKSISQESSGGSEMIDLEQDDNKPGAELDLELELPSGNGTVPDVDVVQGETTATASKEEVQELGEGDATAEVPVADLVLPSVNTMLADAWTTNSSILDDVTAQELEQLQKLSETLLDSTATDVKPRSDQVHRTVASGAIDQCIQTFANVRPVHAFLNLSPDAVLPRATRKRQREDTSMVSSTSNQPSAQPGVHAISESDASALDESTKDKPATAEPVHKRARHAAPVASKHDGKVVAPATWQATIKPFMLGALVGGMGVFGGLLSMADMQ